MDSLIHYCSFAFRLEFLSRFYILTNKQKKTERPKHRCCGGRNPSNVSGMKAPYSKPSLSYTFQKHVARIFTLRRRIHYETVRRQGLTHLLFRVPGNSR